MTLRPQGLVTLRKRLLAGSEAVTIAIGLLCDGGNSILLSADTMISYGSVTSNQGGSKIYDLPLGLFAAVADDISSTQLFIGKLTEELKTITVGDPAFVDKVKIAMQSACADSLVPMRSDILSFVGITENEFLHDKKLVPSLR